MIAAVIVAARNRASGTIVAKSIAVRRMIIAALHPEISARRQTIRDNHGYFVRGAPPPPGVRLVRGQPLPRGYYGERLDNRALAHLPYYQGYEWRRMGGDVVLIAIGSGIVYEILDGVLN